MLLLIDNYDSFTFNLQRYLVRLGQQVQVVRNDDLRLAAFLGQAAVAPSGVCDAGLQPHTAYVGSGRARALRSSPAISNSYQAARAAPLQENNYFGFIGGIGPEHPTAIVLSPGPKRPSDAGYTLEIIRRFSGELPILGVCLGHQAICEAFGGKIIRGLQPMHGRATPIRLSRSPLFEGLDSSTSKGPTAAGSTSESLIEFARYHSLVADPDSLPSCLQVTAWSTDGQIMAVEHRQHRTYGVQFHPESILSPHGYRLLHNFLKLAGCHVAPQLPASDLCARQAALLELGQQSWNEATGNTSDNTSSEHAVAHPADLAGHRARHRQDQD